MPRLSTWFESFARHVRFSVRSLSREPGFAVTAILTLALGSAATTTVFSVVDAELWRPLPYLRVDRLVAIQSHPATQSNQSNSLTVTDLRAWRQSAPALAEIAATGGTRRQTAQLGQAASLLTTEVSANYFHTLGRQALAGRVFTNGDAGTHVAVITERGRERHFDDDPNVVGRSFLLDGRPTLIVGLVATDDYLGTDPDLYLLMNDTVDTETGPTFFSVIGRLADGHTGDVARQQIQAAIDRRTLSAPAGTNVAEVVDLSEANRTSNARQLYFFLGAAIFVLALTIANVAGLIISRAVKRTSEFALRTVLGGSRRSLVAQMMVEAAAIAVPAGIAGLVLSTYCVSAISQFAPDDFLYRGRQINVDLRSALLTFDVSLASTFMLALVPLGLVRRAGERSAVASRGRVGDTPAALRTRRVLLTTQLALTMTLLAGAGIFIKSFVALTHVPLGFEPDNGWSLRMTLSGPRFAEDDALRAYTDDVQRRLEGVAGVTSVSTATSSPLRSGPLANFTLAGAPTDAKPIRTIVRAVGAQYFQTIGTPIVRGRALSADDRLGAPFTIVVNEEFARRAFPNEDAVGKRIVLPETRVAWLTPGSFEIVGVASNIKEIGLNEATMASAYVAFAQHPAPGVEFLVRTTQSPAGTALLLSGAAADSQVPVTAVASLQSRVDSALQQERFNLISMTCFSGLALLMAAIGVYGAMSYAATARAREFGIRLALGASRRSVIGGALAETGRIGSIAGVIGVAGALLAAKALGDSLYLVPGKHNGLLYGVTTTDPMAIASAFLGVLALAILAGVMPARRAANVDPARAMRSES